MQEEDVIVSAKPFDVEEFKRFLAALPEESLPITQPSLNIADERIRDAQQREVFWRAQPENAHRNEELAHALFTQGKIDEALELSTDPERRTYYQSIGFAILKDDNTFCGCPESEKVAIDGKTTVSQFWHKVGEYPSAKHGGKLTPVYRCAKCGDLNVTNEG